MGQMPTPVIQTLYQAMDCDVDGFVRWPVWEEVNIMTRAMSMAVREAVGESVWEAVRKEVPRELPPEDP